jgi:LysM repeat protein
MFSKLNWILTGDKIELTQGFHGQFQGGQALDFNNQGKRLIAPAKIELSRKIKGRTPYQSFCEFKLLNTLGNVFYQIVHFEPSDNQGKIYEQGEEIKGTDTSGNNHYHIALNVNNVWENVLKYTKQDKEIRIVYLRSFKFWKTFDYEKWTFYDRDGQASIQFLDNNVDNTTIVERTYTVQRGDSLWLIAQKELGNGNRWKEIANLNNLNNPSLILPGQKLKLPK